MGVDVYMYANDEATIWPEGDMPYGEYASILDRRMLVLGFTGHDKYTGKAGYLRGAYFGGY